MKFMPQEYHRQNSVKSLKRSIAQGKVTFSQKVKVAYCQQCGTETKPEALTEVPYQFSETKKLCKLCLKGR